MGRHDPDASPPSSCSSRPSPPCVILGLSLRPGAGARPGDLADVRDLAVRGVLVLLAVAGGVWLAGDLDVARDVGRGEALARAGSAPAASRLLRDAARRTSSSVPRPALRASC